MAVALQVLDRLADDAGLLLGVPGGSHRHLLASLALRTQRLAKTAFVVGDEMRGGGKNMGGRAVVALQADHLGAREVLLEAQDVVDLGAAPAIDRLVVVADATDVLGGTGQGGASFTLPCRGRAKGVPLRPQAVRGGVMRQGSKRGAAVTPSRPADAGRPPPSPTSLSLTAGRSLT